VSRVSSFSTACRIYASSISSLEPVNPSLTPYILFYRQSARMSVATSALWLGVPRTPPMKDFSPRKFLLFPLVYFIAHFSQKCSLEARGSFFDEELDAMGCGRI
jgi:hypothetical protein